MSAAPKLVVATSFPVYPPRGGGQVRIFGLYSALAQLGVDVEIVALDTFGSRPVEREIARGVREVRVPKAAEHAEAEYQLELRAGMSVIDVGLAEYSHLTPAYGAALESASRGASAVVASHPFAQPALVACPRLPLIYEAHNVERDLKAGVLRESGAAAEVIGIVERVERACCEDAALVVATSAEDCDRLAELYDLDRERLAVLPNGVDPGPLTFTPLDQRAEAKARLGLAGSFLALFLGSTHEPNLVAIREILETAEALPDTRFLVVGSAGLAFSDARIPPNVDICGVVEAEFIHTLLRLADVALNPMRLGSGTNLKMLDYAYAGVPLLSTSFGARGMGLRPGRDYAVIEDAGLGAAILALRAEPAASVAERAASAHAHVSEHFQWSTIAARWLQHPVMRELLELASVPA